METPRIREELRAIRTSLRRFMNGVVAADMRKHGLVYRVNFGVTLPLLKQIASEHTPDRELAQALWEQDVRECKILAVLLYPPDQFTPETAEAWISSDLPDEIRDLCCTRLLPASPFAPDLALQWLLSGDRARQYAGGQLWSVLFRQHKPITPHQEAAFLEAVKTLFPGGEPSQQAVLLNALHHAVTSSAETAARVMTALDRWKTSSEESLRSVYNDLVDTGLSVGTLFPEK